MMRKLYVVGTGGMAREVGLLAFTIQQQGKIWSAIEYICENPSDIGKQMQFGTITGTDEMLANMDTCADYAIGIGSPKSLSNVAARLIENKNLFAPNLIHPRANLDVKYVSLGVGNIVLFGAAFTCDIKIGNFNIFNQNCTVGHDAELGSFNVINPGSNISGSTKIGDRCLIGTGSQILQGLSICSDTIVGGGALVSKSITSPNTYAGVPARPIK